MGLMGSCYNVADSLLIVSPIVEFPKCKVFISASIYTVHIVVFYRTILTGNL